MSKQLLQATKNILSMPYYKNDHAQSGETVHGHENAVAKKLESAGFLKQDIKNYKSITKTILKKWADSGDEKQLRQSAINLPLGSFITQPASSQGFPDILVRDFDDRFIAFECKSVFKSGSPMWNDSLPRPNAIYILTSGKYNETTMFLGRDVISNQELELMVEQSNVMKRIAEEYKKKLALIDKFGRGFNQKLRKQHFQQGGKDKTDYFIHKNRKTCEKNVLDFVK